MRLQLIKPQTITVFLKIQFCILLGKKKKPNIFKLEFFAALEGLKLVSASPLLRSEKAP